MNLNDYFTSTFSYYEDLSTPYINTFVGKCSSVYFPNCQIIGYYAFQSCTKLSSASFSGKTSTWKTITKGTTFYNTLVTSVSCSDGSVSV